MKQSTTWLASLSVLAISTAAHAQYSASYTVTDNFSSPIYDLMVFEDGPNWGGVSFSFGVDANSSNTLSPFFPPNLQPTTSLLVGLVDNLPGDGGTAMNPVTHVVIGMDNQAATDGANIAWGTLFRNTDEDQLISKIELTNSGQDPDTVHSAADAVGAFTQSDAMTGILNPNGTHQSAWFATGSSFTLEAWSNGEIIGSGTSSVLVTPEPTPVAVLGLGCLGLLLRRRKK